MAEQRLLALDTAMTQAELHLRRARDAEVTAKHTYEAARRRASFDRECPRVERGGATVDMRKQWIEDRCADEAWLRYGRKNVRDCLWWRIAQRKELQSGVVLAKFFQIRKDIATHPRGRQKSSKPRMPRIARIERTGLYFSIRVRCVIRGQIQPDLAKLLLTQTEPIG